MKRDLYLFLTVLCIFTTFTVKPIYAYLDPGTASLILQSVIGAVTATFVMIGLYWQKVKTVIKNILSKKSDDVASNTAKPKKIED